MTPHPRSSRTWRIVIAALFVLALVLQGLAISGQSLIGDAPYHLLAGHQALRYGTNSLNLEHPPLVKLVAALPLLAEEPLARPISVDRVLGESLHIFDDPARAERVRIRSRVLVLLVFGLPFVAACFLLGREVAGAGTGVVLAAVAAFSIPTLPYLSVLQTDAAVALGFTLTAYAALRYLKNTGLRGVALLGLGLGIALAAKFSGVLAVPTAVVAVAAAKVSWRRRLVDLAAAAAVALAFLWATYAVANHSYDPEAGRDTIRRYCHGEALIVDHEMERLEEPLLAIERLSPSAAQYLTGFLGVRIQSSLGVYPSYAFGRIDSRGRWWYFPAVFLIQTPLVVLAASALALWGWRRFRPTPAFLVLGTTLAVYLGTAMTSTYNLGARHLLPVLPILFLPAAAWTAATPRRTAVVLGVLALEAAALTPLWMSATNTWWLGPYNPTRFVLGSVEYRQDFAALAREARRRGVERMHVVFPLLKAREIAEYPPLEVVEPGDELVPGWYAVDVTVEQYIPAAQGSRPEDVRGYTSLVAQAKRWEPLWRQVARGEDHGYIAGTFHLYRLR